MRLLKVLHAPILVLLTGSCYYHDIPRPVNAAAQCPSSGLALTLVSSTPTSSCTASDGALEVSATGGSAPYLYSLNGGAGQSSGVFTGLKSGNFSVQVKDVNTCTALLYVQVTITGSTFTAGIKTIVTDTQCLTDNGSVEFQASGGTGPYQFTLGAVTNATGLFSGLAAGAYTGSVKDASGCQVSIGATVPQGSSTSYANDIKPILNTYCNAVTCHGSGVRDLTTYAKVFAKAALVKSKTADLTMPKPGNPKLTADQIKLIGCWVDEGAQNN